MIAVLQVSPEVFVGLPMQLQTIIKEPIKSLELDFITDKLLPYFNVNKEDLYSRSRRAKIVEARMIVVYLALKTDKYTCVRLGKIFGMDHSSIVYYRIAVNDRMKVDKLYRSRVEQAESLLYSNY